MFDFDGNQALDINEVSIMVICFCAGWSRLTDIKMPSNKKLEGFGEYVNLLFIHIMYRSIMQQRLYQMERFLYKSNDNTD